MSKKGAFIFLAVCVVFAAGALFVVENFTPKYSAVRLNGENLFALNSAAKKGEIKDASKNGYMYFKFTNNQQVRLLNLSRNDTGASVYVSIKPLENKKLVAGDASFSFGFLYKKDFSNTFSLKHKLYKRPLITGEYSAVQQKEFSVSECVDSNEEIPAGFFISCSSNACLTSIQFNEACIGFDKRGSIPYYAFSPEGGVIDYSCQTVDFSTAQKIFPDHNSFEGIMPKIKLGLVPEQNPGTYSEQKAVTIDCGGEKIKIRRNKIQTEVILQTASLKNPFSKINLGDNNKNILCCLLYANSKTYLPVSKEVLYSDKPKIDFKNSMPLSVQDAAAVAPLVTDIGMIFDWPKKNWRSPEYELYSWEMFPSVLLFDFADYRTQNLFLTRLAYFVEKAGYKGTFISDSDVETKHGYNAHDYKPEDLAEFFTQAKLQRFRLNECELVLRSILVFNGVIIQNKDGTYSAGEGAVISISKESAEYLRWKLSAHESWHGIYFTDENFRNKVEEMYNRFDPVSMMFLKTYWSTQPTLCYDIEDDYLMKNEFMSYLLQQKLSATAEYFVNIASWRSVNENDPENAKYIRRTKAAYLEDACSELNDYVFDRWGLAAGRVNLISR